MEMQYRHLGRAGVQVSVLSFGSWLTFGDKVAVDTARECLAAAYEAGVNFFDNAESYSDGQSETIMGEALAKLKWPRHSYLISSKYYWGMVDGVNTRNTLNRKYLLQAVDGSLRRLQQDFIDLIFCHRPDPNTPIEETVRTMHEIVSSGKALYWGTSEWSADEIIEAFEIAEREHLHRPTMEQPEYSLLRRDRVEKEFAPLYDRLGLGLTTFSPLGAGVLTGKYLNGIPEGSRAAMVASWSPEWKPLVDVLTDPVSNDKVRALKAIADDLGASLAQLSIAWCAANPHVSSVITGASNVSQVNENLKSMEVLEKLAPDVRERVDAIFE